MRVCGSCAHRQLGALKSSRVMGCCCMAAGGCAAAGGGGAAGAELGLQRPRVRDRKEAYGISSCLRMANQLKWVLRSWTKDRDSDRESFFPPDIPPLLRPHPCRTPQSHFPHPVQLASWPFAALPLSLDALLATLLVCHAHR